MTESTAPFEMAEATVQQAVQWLRLAIETTGGLIVALGVAISLLAFAKAFWHRHDRAYGEGYNGVRLTLARYLALALEFQLGADILSTAIAPTWTAIGKLGAIAVIRTALNYFLGREMRDEAGRLDPHGQAGRAARPADGRSEPGEPGRPAPARPPS
jgi:uncharacterized membrane protein